MPVRKTETALDCLATRGSKSNIAFRIIALVFPGKFFRAHEKIAPMDDQRIAMEAKMLEKSSGPTEKLKDIFVLKNALLIVVVVLIRLDCCCSR